MVSLLQRFRDHNTNIFRARAGVGLGQRLGGDASAGGWAGELRVGLRIGHNRTKHCKNQMGNR